MLSLGSLLLGFDIGLGGRQFCCLILLVQGEPPMFFGGRRQQRDTV